MVRSLLLTCFLVAPLLLEDQALKRPLQIDGRRNKLSTTLSEIQECTGRTTVLSESVPDYEVFLASHRIQASLVMEGLAELLSDRQFRYVWPNAGPESQPRYLFSRVASNKTQLVADARRRLELALSNGPRFTPMPIEKISGNDALPARYELLRSLPPGVRARTVNQALAGRPAILPLSMFDRSTLIAATGKVTTFSMRDGQKVITFSWKDVAAGKGHVVLHRTNTPDGSLGLKVSIRTGSPKHDPDRTAGPTSDLIHRGDVQRTRSAATQLASRSGGNTNGGAPASRPNHQSGDRRIAIIHNRKLEKKALPLDDVLKQLAEQGNLAVLAKWPRDFAPARQRLPAALADVSVEEATRRIEGYYHLRATAKEQVIRFTVASRGSALDR